MTGSVAIFVRDLWMNMWIDLWRDVWLDPGGLGRSD